MSHPVNEVLVDTIRELRELISFLESELLDYSLRGEIEIADEVYGELIDARIKLAELEDSVVR